VWSATYACIQVNAGNSIVFALMGLFCILSPIFVNWIGVKKTLIAGTLGWTVYSAALYQNNRYGTEWFVLLGAVICGLSAGLYWAAEGAIVLSYPEHAKRGRYLALWLGFKNSGQVGVPSFADAKNSDWRWDQLIGGAINLGLNANRAEGGRVSYVTLLVFVVLQALAVPVSFCLSPPNKTQRPDGSAIVVESKTSTREQFRKLWKTVTTRQMGLLLPIFFSCWFYWVSSLVACQMSTMEWVRLTQRVFRATHRHISLSTSLSGRERLHLFSPLSLERLPASSSDSSSTLPDWVWRYVPSRTPAMLTHRHEE
jgi:MFS family permease